MGTKTFDRGCYDLAKSFLEDEECFMARQTDLDRELMVQKLAIKIQETIEDYIESQE